MIPKGNAPTPRKNSPAFIGAVERFGPFALLCLVIFGFFMPVSIGKGLFFKDQIYEFHYQAWEFLKAHLATGEFPLWNPLIGCGYPFVHYPEYSLFYPPAWIFLMVFPTAIGATLLVYFHYLMAAFFTYLFCRSIKVGRTGSLIAGLVFALNGFSLERYSEIQNQGAFLWLPALLFLARKAVHQRTVFRIVATGLALGTTLLAGGVQYSYYTLLAFSAYILWESINLDIRSLKRRILIAAVCLMVIFAVALGLFAVQLLPSAQLSSMSNRSSATMSTADTIAGDPLQKYNLMLTPEGVGGMLYPLLQQVPTNRFKPLFLGMVVIFLGMVGIVAGPKKPVIFFTTLMAVSFLMAFGNEGFLFPLVAKLQIPGFSFFKNPLRFFWLFMFTWAILSALGAHELLRRKWSPSGRNILMAVFIAEIFVLFFIIHKNAGGLFNIFQETLHNQFQPDPGVTVLESAPVFREHFIFILGTFALFGVFVYLHLHEIFPTRLAGLGLLAFCVLGMIPGRILLDPLSIPAVVQKTKPTGVSAFLLSKGIAEEGRAFVLDPSNRFEKYNLQELVENTGMAQGIPMVDINSALLTSDFLLFTGAGEKNEPYRNNPYYDFLYQPNLTALTRLRFLMMGANSGRNRPPNFSKEVYADNTTRIFKADRLLPEAFLVNHAETIPDTGNALALLMNEDFDVAKSVVLNKEISSWKNSEQQSMGAVSVKKKSANEMEMKIDTEKPNILVWLESYFPDWQAVLDTDGSELEILQADMLFMAVVVPAGKHTVVFSFRPKRFYLGLAITLATLVIGLATLFLFRKSTKKVVY